VGRYSPIRSRSFEGNPEDFFIEDPAEGNGRRRLSMVAAAE
jgi:hypothetical protein